jgi:methionyl-tRNA formyltransferase
MKNLCVFTYAFDHAKCQNGLLKLITSGYHPKIVIAQPAKELEPNPDSIGVSPKQAQSLSNWQKLLGYLQITYIIADHDSETAIEAIKKHNCDFGVILGARILKQKTIDALPHGILNMHPGLLPINRGLDNLKKAILWDIDPAVSFHLIDSKIDAGKLLFTKIVPLYPTDTIHSVFLRHQTVELDGMIEALFGLEHGLLAPEFTLHAEYSKKLGDRYDKEVLAKFPSWLMKRTLKN